MILVFISNENALFDRETKYFLSNISHHLLTFSKINENENALFDRETNFYQGQHFKASRL